MRPVNAWFCRRVLHGFLRNGITTDTAVLYRHKGDLSFEKKGITNLCSRNSNEKIHYSPELFETRLSSKLYTKIISYLKENTTHYHENYQPANAVQGNNFCFF